jgi:hypothetical protein
MYPFTSLGIKNFKTINKIPQTNSMCHCFITCNGFYFHIEDATIVYWVLVHNKLLWLVYIYIYIYIYIYTNVKKFLFLKRIPSSLFFIQLNLFWLFFINVIFQYLIDFELVFIICFDLFFMRLSLS